MSTDQSNPPPLVRPIWTPEDARQAAADAAKHRAEPGVPAEYRIPPRFVPPHRNPDDMCLCCSAWPGELCEPGCLTLMSPEDAQRHRDEVLDRTLAELGITAVPALMSPPRGRTPERGGMRPRRARRLTKTVLAAAAIVALMAAGVLWAASRAGAAPLPGNCQQQLWLYGGLFGRWTTRTICDGPIREDGSWVRSRNFYASARWVPVSCSWGSYGGSCSGGYPLPEFDTGVEQYVVTVDTVLPDEPGHIGQGR